MSLLFVIHEGLANNAAFRREKKTVSTDGPNMTNLMKPHRRKAGTKAKEKVSQTLSRF